MTNRIQDILKFSVKNFLLFFQIYAIVYVFINSYINMWFSLDKENFLEFEKIIIINFFQAEVFFVYMFYHKFRNKDYGILKIRYLSYIEDMENQDINKRKASISLLIGVLIFIFVFTFLIWKSPFGNFIKLVIGLNEILVKNINLLIPCLLFVVFFYLKLKYEVENASSHVANRFAAIIYSFFTAFPIFILLYVVRVYFSGKTEDSFVPAGLLAINLSFLITIIKQKSFNAINSKP